MSASPRIRIVRGGPMLVEGLASHRLLRDDAGSVRTEPVEPSPGAAYAICRCGRSSTLPLCDAGPPYACFREEPSDGPTPAPFRWEVPDPSRPGLALKPNGPVRVAGGVPIETEVGAVPAVDRISLCRCGASRSQPLCDGSHKVVGYREPADTALPRSRPPR